MLLQTYDDEKQFNSMVKLGIYNCISRAYGTFRIVEHFFFVTFRNVGNWRKLTHLCLHAGTGSRKQGEDVEKRGDGERPATKGDPVAFSPSSSVSLALSSLVPKARNPSQMRSCS